VIGLDCEDILKAGVHKEGTCKLEGEVCIRTMHASWNPLVWSIPAQGISTQVDALQAVFLTNFSMLF
jgi:hypothetical protein